MIKSFKKFWKAMKSHLSLYDKDMSRHLFDSVELNLKKYALEKEKFFREKAEECYENHRKALYHELGGLDKDDWFLMNIYFSAVADAWKEIAEGKCENIEKRLKEVDEK